MKLPQLFLILAIFATVALAPDHAPALSDAEIETVTQGFEGRRDAYLRDYLTAPLFEMDPGMEACRDELQRAQWIWHPGEDGARLAPLGIRCFRRTVTLPADRTLLNAYGAFAADNYAELLVNGQKVSRPSGFSQATPVEISRYLKPGENDLTLIAHNAGDAPNPAGVLGMVQISFETGDPLTLLTDGSWQSTELAPGAAESSLPVEGWQAVDVLGPAGSSPWGKIALRMDVKVNQYVFSRLCYALAALHLQTDETLAKQRILEAVEQVRQEQQSSGEFGLHWMGGVFYRVYGLFGPGGIIEERLDPEVSEAVADLFADWARDACRLEDADPEHTWRIWGSENHSAQRDATRWAAARILATEARYADYRYADGSTPAQQLAAWRIWLKRYYQERIKRGMLVEISPSGYGSRTLQGWHNIYDFTDDPELKACVKGALDLWWAEWAQEQLGGMRGGGKTRLYPGAWALSGHDRNRAMSWFYLGEGPPAHQHETLPVIATTTYRLPPVITDIALDPEGRGVYEIQSRKPGRHLDYGLSQALSEHEEPVYTVDPDYGAIARYSYCTPDFIMGTLHLESRPEEYWTAISQQNRWHGIIFAGDKDSTLYPRCQTDRSTYNGQWAIQHKGTLITQKLRQAQDADAMRVCFSTDLERHEKGGWYFVRATSAFAAVKIVSGGATWDDERWLRCDDEFTPLIFEVVRSQDYDNNVEAFEKAILAQSVHFVDGELRYTGLGGTGDFTFYATSDRAPELNGAPINLAPAYTYQSPFLNEDWASGRVTIRKGERERVIDVRDGE